MALDRAKAIIESIQQEIGQGASPLKLSESKEDEAQAIAVGEAFLSEVPRPKCKRGREIDPNSVHQRVKRSIQARLGTSALHRSDVLTHVVNETGVDRTRVSVIAAQLKELERGPIWRWRP